MVAIFKNIWNTSATKNLVVHNFFEKLVNNKVVDHLEKSGFFLMSSMTSGLLIQQQFWQDFGQDLAHWHYLKFGTLQSRSKCDNVSDFGEQLEHEVARWFQCWKNSTIIQLKNHPMIPGLSFSSKLRRISYSISIAKTAT